MARWPHDDPKSLDDFYGSVDRDEPGQRLVPVTPPFKMYYDGKPVDHIMFHKKAAVALALVLDAIWEYYGRDQAKIDALRISHYSGAYNRRKIAGSSRWSNHAYGAAIDLDAEHNGFNTGHGTMPKPVVDAFKAEGALWGGDYKGRTDPMHFEFCSRGETATVAKPKPPAAVQPVPPPPPQKPVPRPPVLPPPAPPTKPPPPPIKPPPRPVPQPVAQKSKVAPKPKKPTEDEILSKKLRDLEPKR